MAATSAPPAAGTLPPPDALPSSDAATGQPVPAPALAVDAAHAEARLQQPSQPIHITVQQRTAPAEQDPGDAAGMIADAVRAIEEAIAAGDVPRAQAALGRLEALLPTGSLTLLRMRAWVAHGSQDMAAAEQLYRRVLERVPDDLNAGVNIALVDARRGDIADARRRLMRLAGQHARSPLVARALAELDAPLQ